MNHISCDPPDFKFHILGYVLYGIITVLRLERKLAIFDSQAFDSKLTIDGGDDNITIFGLLGTVNDQQIASMYASPGHRIACNPDNESGRRILYQMLIKV